MLAEIASSLRSLAPDLARPSSFLQSALVELYLPLADRETLHFLLCDDDAGLLRSRRLRFVSGGLLVAETLRVLGLVAGGPVAETLLLSEFALACLACAERFSRQQVSH